MTPPNALVTTAAPCRPRQLIENGPLHSFPSCIRFLLRACALLESDPAIVLRRSDLDPTSRFGAGVTRFPFLSAPQLLFNVYRWSRQQALRAAQQSLTAIEERGRR